MQWLLSALGVLVVVAVMRDLFHTLFHPIGRGSITRGVMRSVSWLCRLSRHCRRASGPLGMVSVIAAWGGLTVVGWTLIYFAQMPDGFSFAPSLNPDDRHSLLDSLYLSMVTAATLGFGDIVPVSPTLRLAAPLEAVMGFLLFTSAVSWVLQIYPALTRRRVLSLRLVALARARRADPQLADAGLSAALLGDLATCVSQTRVDLAQYAATYYFRDEDEETSLALTIRHAADFADAGARDPDPQTRLAAAVLANSLDDVAAQLDRSFLNTGGDTRQVLRAWADRQ